MALNPGTLGGELTTLNLGVANMTANANGTLVDLAGFIGTVHVVLNAAAGTNDNQSLTVKLQHSIDSNTSNAADFDPAVSFTAIAANGAAQVQTLALDTRVARRFVRIVSNQSAAGNGRVYSVTLSGKRQVTG
jgi:hypothetical protein